MKRTKTRTTTSEMCYFSCTIDVIDNRLVEHEPEIKLHSHPWQYFVSRGMTSLLSSFQMDDQTRVLADLQQLKTRMMSLKENAIFEDEFDKIIARLKILSGPSQVTMESKRFNNLEARVNNLERKNARQFSQVANRLVTVEDWAGSHTEQIMSDAAVRHDAGHHKIVFKTPGGKSDSVTIDLTDDEFHLYKKVKGELLCSKLRTTDCHRQSPAVTGSHRQSPAVTWWWFSAIAVTLHILHTRIFFRQLMNPH